ncbi:MAG TPA: response regulator transcription factor [Rhodocyclaceae bacterium]
MIRLLIADDHDILRSGLRQLFSSAGDIVVAAEAADGPQVLDVLRTETFDVVLLDLSMPGTSGVDLVARIVDRYPRLAIVVLSMHNEPQIAERALKAGAAGYVTKDSDAATLLAAVRAGARGERFVAPKIALKLVFRAVDGTERQPHERLSDRELAVMQLLVRGETVAAIAGILAISAKTVSTHKMRLLQKMGLRNRTELIRYAIDHKLVE